MFELLRSTNIRVLLLLLIATAATFQISGEASIGFYAGTGTLVIAYLKGRLIALDFMELRHAPLVWRLAIEGWLLLVSAMLLTVYWLGTFGVGVA